MNQARTLGIVAGRGNLPVIAARNAVAKGWRVIVSIIKETGAKWPRDVGTRVETISIGLPSTTLSLFNGEGVSEVLIIGKVDKTLNFVELEFDEMALPMLAKLAERGDMNFSRVIIEEFTSRGFHVANQTDFLDDLLAPDGLIAGNLEDSWRTDIAMGMQIARELAKYDIGQTVVLRQGAVIAVEAFEHTDETIRRAGRMVDGGFLVVKAARPDQDFRFDVPTIGPATVRVLAKTGGKVLAVQAHKTIVVDRANLVRIADENGICVVGIA